MDITQISIILSIIACIMTAILLPFTLYALILVKSLEKQTHTVQFMPAEESLTSSNFADPDNVFDEINKEQQEENEDIFRMV
jgi:dolichyl-phosphate-mannose--protein O-mannosyl transferase